MLVFNLPAIPVALVAFGLAYFLAGPLGLESSDMLIGPALVAADLLLRIVLSGFRISGLWTPKAGGTIFWFVPLYAIGLLISWGSLPTVWAASVTGAILAVAIVLYISDAKRPPEPGSHEYEADDRPILRDADDRIV